MNRAKMLYRNKLGLFPKIVIMGILLFCLLLFDNFVISKGTEMSKEYPEPQEVPDTGGSVIGELDYELTPGWWQYVQSCDWKKWTKGITSDGTCEQQKHDFESVVKPTLSKMTEIVVPDYGDIVVSTELRKIGGEIRSPVVDLMLHPKDGSEVRMLWGEQRHQVEKGDQLLVRVTAAMRQNSGGRAYDPQGVKVQVFFIPDITSKLDKSIPDKDGDGVPDSEDKCPDTCTGLKVNNQGCPDAEHVFDEAYKQLGEMEKKWQETYPTSPFSSGKAMSILKDTRFICLWNLLDPDGKFLNRKGRSEDQHRLINKFEKTHEYFMSPEGKHMERLPNTANPDFICHDWAWYLWRMRGTKKVEPKAPGSKETSNGLPINKNGHIDTDRIVNDPEAYGFKEIEFHKDAYRELHAGDVIVYSKTLDGKADHSAVVNSNRGTGNPDDVICLSKAEGNSIFKHALGRFGDPNNYFQKTFAWKKIRIFRPVDEPGRRKNFYVN